MDKPECVMNPKSGRAVKTSGKLGQKMLQEQQNAETTPHTMCTSASDVRPNGKDFEKKKELENVKETKTADKPLEENNKPDPVDSTYMYVCIFMYTYVCVCVCVCVCVYIHMYIYICICMYTYTHTHTRTHTHTHTHMCILCKP